MIIKNFQDIKSLFLDNRTAKQTILKNTFWLTVSEAVNRLFKLVLIIGIARTVGVADYGRFTFSLAFVSLFTIFSDFGLSAITTREFSQTRNKENDKEYSAIISLKLLLSVGALAIMIAGSFFLFHDPAIKTIILILAFYIIANDFSESIYAFFRSRQQMQYESWSKILQGFVTLAAGIFVILKSPSVVNLSYVYLAASLVSLVYILSSFHSKIYKLRFSWDRQTWQKFLVMSWPLALLGIFSVIYTQADSVIMGGFGQIIQTGWYNAAAKIIDIIIVPAGLISLCFFPAISRFSKESKKEMQKLWDFQGMLIIMLITPIIAGGVALASKIVLFFYHADYQPSILAFQILLFSVAPAYFYNVFFRLFIISSRQKLFSMVVAFVALAGLALNIFIIPRFSLYGAATVDVATNMAIFLILAILTKKYTSIAPFSPDLLKTLTISAIATAAMLSVILNPIINSYNIFYVICIGAAAYIFIVFGVVKIFKVKII